MSLSSTWQRPEEGGGPVVERPRPEPVERRFYPIKVTWVLLGLLLLSALFGGVSTDVAHLRQLGARPPLYGFNPRPQHLIVPLFLHGGWGHFLCNFFSLFTVGSALEMVAGGACLVYLFLTAGIASLVGSLIQDPQVTSLGCSGAVFGIWTARVVHGWCPPLEEDRFRLLGLYIFSVALTIVPARLGVPVDHVGHFAGMIAGALSYLAFRLSGGIRWGWLLLVLGLAGWVARPPWSPF